MITQLNSPASNFGIRLHLAANWVHLFSDGVVARDSDNALPGGVVRDRNGNWILGYNHFLGRCSPLEAELWSIHDGLLILLSRGYKKARIQTDNLEVVKTLSMEVPVDSGITILRRIKRLMRFDGSVCPIATAIRPFIPIGYIRRRRMLIVAADEL
ncbi:hypothetical protein J1N35_042874 [Gossypium stocksii]|uniref:RNase H type-1 domain-containing protein n=1 Tax=Gossypium stocksii TaxID=47602 RepID=A0A9D3U693_9ROSI|nr:hypothetical protein J1N35_042874 [Gossypium stocksii]